VLPKFTTLAPKNNAPTDVTGVTAASGRNALWWPLWGDSFEKGMDHVGSFFGTENSGQLMVRIWPHLGKIL
jgi:hypothetical protein